MMNKIPIRPNVRKIIIAAAIAVVVVPCLILVVKKFLPSPAPSYELIIPWNEGGAVDLTLREIFGKLELTAPKADFKVTNIHGGGGSTGLNEVYARPHDGKTFLGMNLYSFVTIDYMGFTQYSHERWDIWFAAFSPSVVAVPASSPFGTLEELIECGRAGQLTCGNAGKGTLSFVSGYLFSQDNDLQIRHVNYTGLNPAVSALIAEDVDFITPLYTEIHSEVKNGNIKILGNVGGDVDIGEYYGFMLPTDTKNDLKNSFSISLGEILASDDFAEFLTKHGLEPTQIKDEKAQDLAKEMKKITVGVLYSSGAFSKKPVGE